MNDGFRPNSVSNMETQNTYRLDIDGLRAIAVISVLIFHAHHSIIPGGFVGVDIFFVISGYLISKHIATEIKSQKFSLLEFYRRRIRRIAPMMLIVIAATLCVAVLFMTPEDATAVAKSAVWSVASLANIYFWRDLDTGYFAQSSAEIPLLHLWSLGVEEQFYMLWPLLLYLGIRWFSPSVVLGLVFALALTSFELASRIFPIDDSWAYYMLPTRMGGLLLGALAGITPVMTSWRMPPWLAWVSGWAGAGLLGLSFWGINAEQPFPGWLALLPAAGAVLLIAAGENGPNPVIGLTCKPMVFMGRISYSAYLWHWPFFAFFRYGYGEPSLMAGIMLLSATLLLAYLSFRFIEQPTRTSTSTFSVLAFRQFLAPATALLTLALCVVYANRIGLPLGSENYLNKLTEVRELIRPTFTFDWICQKQRISPVDLSDSRCVLGASQEPPKILLWGDSNAAHYVPMLNEIFKNSEISFRNIAVGACPPLLLDQTPYLEARRLNDCIASTKLIKDEIEKYSTVIVSAAWTSYQARSDKFISDFESTVKIMSESGKRVIIIGRTPTLKQHDSRCQEKSLKIPFKECHENAEEIPREVIQINNHLRSIADRAINSYYFDANSYLCPNKICERYTSSGLPRYIDASHLSVTGSTELGKLIIKTEGMPSAFRQTLK